MASAWSTDTVTAVNYHSDAESIVRLNNKSLGENERNQTYKRWWKEQVRLYGTKVDYYARKFDIDKTDKVYGENPYQGFYPKATFVMLIDLTDGAITYSQYGLVSDDELTAIIDIETFENELSGSPDLSQGLKGVYPSRPAIAPGVGDTLCKDIWVDPEKTMGPWLSAGDSFTFQSVAGDTYTLTASSGVAGQVGLFDAAEAAGTHFNCASFSPVDAERAELILTNVIMDTINNSPQAGDVTGTPLSAALHGEWRRRHKVSGIFEAGNPVYGFRVTQKEKLTTSTLSGLPFTITEGDGNGNGYWTGTANHTFDEKQIAEPNAGDVFQLIEFGDDRPEGRNGKIFEITERLDESVKEINQLQGHYVFKLRARRNDHTFLPTVIGPGETSSELAAEAKSTQVSDASGAGRVTDPDTDYGNDLDTEQSKFFDYGTNDDVYGDYY